MDKYNEKAWEFFDIAWPHVAGKDFNEKILNMMAAFGRQSAAQAYEDAARVAQIEVNACESHAKASRGRDKRFHSGVGMNAKFLVGKYSELAAALRAPDERPEQGKL